MAWGKIDDGLHKSAKWRQATKPARALWTTALSWSMDELTDGFVPSHIIPMLDGTRKEAQSLVDAGLWDVRRGGWRFHDWSDYQPDAASIKAKRAKEAEGAALGNHRRWHIGRSVRVPGCEYCEGMPPEQDVEPPIQDFETYRVPDQVPDRGADGVPDSPPNRPVPEPDPDSGSEILGGYVSSGSRLHPPQACGDRHDPEKSCHRCGRARQKAKESEAEAQRVKAASDRAAIRAAQAKRRAEDEAARAEAEADPERVAEAKARALAAVKEAS